MRYKRYNTKIDLPWSASPHCGLPNVFSVNRRFVTLNVSEISVLFLFIPVMTLQADQNVGFPLLSQLNREELIYP